MKPYARYDGAVPAGATPPYEDLLGAPSYEVCPGCDFEFGNDDNPGTAPPVSFEEYRQEWQEERSEYTPSPHAPHPVVVAEDKAKRAAVGVSDRVEEPATTRSVSHGATPGRTGDAWSWALVHLTCGTGQMS
ncbi:MAG TPA: hypothetical protein VNA20_08975 [Frankiaceae bacterium]|nr:hypothetical protein [Frankiaceae bacterium]